MAPTQARKRKSDEMATPEATTPSGSPTSKRMKITQSQKQALIDNLQLEITERARKLRAQYALQGRDLRSRIERRIHRIPLALRSEKMGGVWSKESPAPPLVKAAKGAAIASSNTLQSSKTRTNTATQPVKINNKRKSAEIRVVSDKENDASSTAVAPAPMPAASRAKAGILSPRSHNSRTLPKSPSKSNLSRPASPIKSHSPLKSAASAATSAISASVQGMLSKANSKVSRKGAAHARPESALSSRSEATDTSTNTVVTKAKTKRARAAPVAAAKTTTTTAASKAKAAPKITVASKKAAKSATATTTATTTTATATATAIGGDGPKRVLRKRT